MAATIHAHIPSYTEVFEAGNTYTWKEDTLTFEQNDAGVWHIVFGLERYPVPPEDVIDDCLEATNWPEIRAAHFPEYGTTH